jgi:putative transposase
MKISRSVYGYRSQARDATPLIMRIKEIKATRVHYGYRRVHVLLRREGWKDNHKRVLRIPAQAGQRFQPKLDSDSKASWTLIPAQPGQPKVIT